MVNVVRGISTSLLEQGQASNDISAQVEKVAQMTMKNNEAASEAASAANELKALANAMKIAVGRFQI